MILPFKKEFNGEPSNFESKIWAGLIENKVFSKADSMLLFLYYSNNCKKFPMYNTFKPKIHTIREIGRWEIGNKIHFATGVRTKKYYQFAPTLKVVSKQKIYIGNANSYNFIVYINDTFLDKKSLTKLSENDGFDSILDFFTWFKKSCEMEIIHWTDFKY